MMLGPGEHGQFYDGKVMSIRRNRVSCRHIKAGQSATLALSGVEKTFIRRVSKFSNMFFHVLFLYTYI